MTEQQKAAIEVASKLPTAEETLNNLKQEFDSVGTKFNGLTWDRIRRAIESHTAAHTAALRERHQDTIEAMGNKYLDLERRFVQSERLLSNERERVKQLESLMQEFVDRVDRGEVRSKKTYAKFKEALK